LRFADEIGERYGEIEYKGSGTVLERRRGLDGNVSLSHDLMSFLFTARCYA